MTTATTPKKLYLFQLSTTSVPLTGAQTLVTKSGCALVDTSCDHASHQSVIGSPQRTGRVHLAVDAVMTHRTFPFYSKAWPSDDNDKKLVSSRTILLLFLNGAATKEIFIRSLLDQFLF